MKHTFTLLLTFFCVLFFPVLANEGFVNNHGVKIFFRDIGEDDKQAIVFIHGLPLNGKQFRCQIEDLKRFFRIITIDLRGFGKSDKDVTDFSYPAFLSDVEAVVHHLKLHKPNIAGFSFGSIVAELYAINHPKNINKLILLSPFYGQILNIGGFTLGINPSDVAPLIALLPNHKKKFDKAFIALGTPETCDGIQEVRNFMLKLAAQTPVETEVGFLNAQLIPTGIPALLPNIKTPTLIVYGNQDVLTNREGILALRQTLVNSMLYEVTGGHFIPLTQSKLVDCAILRFLTANPDKCLNCF